MPVKQRKTLLGKQGYIIPNLGYEEYVIMSEVNATIGQLVADKEHMCRLLKQKNDELREQTGNIATLNKLIKNQTAGGAAMKTIIDDQKSEIAMAEGRAIDHIREATLYYEISGDLRVQVEVLKQLCDDRYQDAKELQVRLDASRRLAEDRQELIDTKQAEVFDVRQALRNAEDESEKSDSIIAVQIKTAALLRRDIGFHKLAVEQGRKQVGVLNREVDEVRQQIRDQDDENDVVDNKIAELIRENKLVVQLSNTTLTELHDSQAAYAELEKANVLLDKWYGEANVKLCQIERVIET